MAKLSRRLRVSAAVIALICWLGLAVQFSATFAQGYSVQDTVWIMIRYFTILTNTLVALVFTGIAFGRGGFANPFLLGLTTTAIALVGIVNHFLLRGLLELRGGAQLADTILHYLAPIAVMAFWLRLAPRGGLSRGDPVIWAIYPIVYVVYALVRGSLDGQFAYPFLNYPELGWAETLVALALILIGFLAGGSILVWLDKLLLRPASAAI